MTGRRAAVRAAAAALVVWAAAAVPNATAAASGTSHAPKTPVHHLVVLMQENHTFDNYFGTYPGVDGLPPGTAVPVDPTLGPKPAVSPFHVGNRSVFGLDHGVQSAVAAFNGGRMDGFVKAQKVLGGAGNLTMGHFDGRDIPYYWNMANRYVLFDRFFSPTLLGSFLSHVYWVAAAGGNATPAVPPAGLQVQTIFDRLQQAGVSWKFYVQNYDPKITYRTMGSLKDRNRATQVIRDPLLAIPRFLDRPALRSHIVDLSQYYTDLRDGTLPAVAYIAPAGSTEQAPGNLLSGQRFVRGVVNALMASGSWRNAAFLLTYDGWGGWYDHVRPPRRDGHLDGFRVPTLLVSPYARHAVDHTTLDTTSILRFIEQNWRLHPLGRLDASAHSIMGAFDFGTVSRPATVIPLTRAAAPPPARRVRDALLYASYGVGVLLAAGLFVWATPALRPGGRRRAAARTGGPS